MQTSTKRSLSTLISQVREDLQRHECGSEGAIVALAVYRFGNWAADQRPALRTPALRLYGWAEKITRAATRVHMDRRVKVGDDLQLGRAPGSISVHPSVVIGNRVQIMHDVTIGLEPGARGAPVIGDDVFIGVGAVILGRVKVGDRSSIAANSLVISDVPPDSIAIGVPARVVPRHAAPQLAKRA